MTGYQTGKMLLLGHGPGWLCSFMKVGGISCWFLFFFLAVHSSDSYGWTGWLYIPVPEGGVKPRCGGTMINKRYVITAAHCVSREILDDTKLWDISFIFDSRFRPFCHDRYRACSAFVRLGEHKLSTNPDCTGATNKNCQPPHIDVLVEEIIIHSNFSVNNRKATSSDIALLRLAEDVDLQNHSKTLAVNAFSRSFHTAILNVKIWDFFFGRYQDPKSFSANPDSQGTEIRSIIAAFKLHLQQM